MSLSFRVRNRMLPFVAAGAMATLFATPAQANNPPQVTVNGVQPGVALQLGNPVQFQGVARDSEGIARIYGTIQSAKDQQFVTQQGGLSKNPSRLKFKYTNSTATRWASQSFNLPAGNYVFRIRVEDGQKAISPMMEIPFVATGAAAQRTTAAQAPAQSGQVAGAAAGAAPAIAIQFPQNGAVLNQAAAFSGIAKDDQAVVGVIATIMDKRSGMFLTSNGQFAASGQLKLRTIKGKNAQWTSPQVQLPPGDYLLSVKAIDNAGQEGQWAQSQFSVAGAAANTAATTTATAAATTTAAPGGKAANGMSYCSNAGMDADGDGYGWENQASCVVVGSKADKFHTCASSASDPDGDGYGWENEKSCIVVTHCASAASDPDGDGFGWENERSCVVLKQASGSGFPNCRQGAASDPDGDGYGWENNATCLVK